MGTLATVIFRTEFGAGRVKVEPGRPIAATGVTAHA